MYVYISYLYLKYEKSMFFGFSRSFYGMILAVILANYRFILLFI